MLAQRCPDQRGPLHCVVILEERNLDRNVVLLAKNSILSQWCTDPNHIGFVSAKLNTRSNALYVIHMISSIIPKNVVFGEVSCLGRGP